jgi:hypothetical protein
MQLWTNSAFALITSTGANGIYTAPTTQTGQYFGPVMGKFMRLLFTGTAGYFQGMISLSALTPFSFINTSQVFGTITPNASTATAGTQLGVLPAVANAAVQVVAEGKQQLLSTDLAMNLRVAPGYSAILPPIEAPGNTYNLSMNTNGQLRIDMEDMRRLGEMQLLTEQETSMRVMLGSEQYGGGNYGFELR